MVRVGESRCEIVIRRKMKGIDALSHFGECSFYHLGIKELGWLGDIS